MNPRVFRATWPGGLALALLAGGGLLGAQAQKPVAPPQPPGQGTASGQTTTPPATSTQAGRGRGAAGQTPAPQVPGAPSRGGQGPGPGRPDTNGPRAPWWKDEAIKKEIGLREDQARRIDQIYESRAKAIAPWNDEILKQRELLNALMLDRTVTSTAIELQVDRMELPRMKVNESYFVMLHRMYMQLDPEQNKKLQAIFDRSRDHGRGGGSQK
jgi:Spy/CpxP family protein refolding chaperone